MNIFYSAADGRDKYFLQCEGWEEEDTGEEWDQGVRHEYPGALCLIMPIARLPHRQYTLTNSVSCATLTLTSAEVATVIMPIARLPHRQYTLTNSVSCATLTLTSAEEVLKALLYSNYANCKAFSSPVHSYKFCLMWNINPNMCGGRS
jgi:hypothetical protein